MTTLEESAFSKFAKSILEKKSLDTETLKTALYTSEGACRS